MRTSFEFGGFRKIFAQLSEIGNACSSRRIERQMLKREKLMERAVRRNGSLFMLEDDYAVLVEQQVHDQRTLPQSK